MMLVRCLLFACLVAVCAAPARCSDWPQFRGPGGSAASDSADPPLRWGDAENIIWKTPLPGRGASSPVVWGDRVFLTAFTGFGASAEQPGDKSRLRLHVLSLDRRSGRIVWNKELSPSQHTQDFSKRVADHGYSTATPVTDGQGVYAFFGVSGLAALDWDGNLMWRADVGTKTAGFGSASSPVLFENLVIVNASIESGALFAFDKTSGRQIWKVQPVNRTWTTPCIAPVDGSHELVLNHKDVILGLDPRTGEQLWSCAGIEDYIVPAPIAHDGIVYCLGGRSNRSIAVKLGGRGDVTDTHKLWETRVGANVTSPVYYEGRLYWASDKAIANCLDAETGEALYRQRLPTRARIYASVVRAKDRLYVTTRDQGVVVIGADPQYRQLARNVIANDDDLLNASPALSGDHLLLRSDSFLYCIGRDGKGRKTSEAPSP